jgi:transposase
MNTTGTITLSMHELDRLRVIQAVAERQLKPDRAAERLHVSVRQIERLVMRYRADGARGLVSGKRARTSNHRLPDGVAQRALALIRERYADFGPTLAREKLDECHGITLGKETVRRWMRDAGVWIPRRQRPPKIYQVGLRRFHHPLQGLRVALHPSNTSAARDAKQTRGNEPSKANSVTLLELLAGQRRRSVPG